MEKTNITAWAERARRWRLFGSPLAPHADDIEFFVRQITEWHAENGGCSPTALLLGVTPEIALMPWPSEFSVFGVDHSSHMIELVWPCHGHPKRYAIMGDWRKLPFPNASANIIICDGGFLFFKYPAGFRNLFNELARVLRNNGLLVARFFTQSEQKQDPDDVFRQLSDGELSNFHEFKFRLNMALQESAEAGLVVRQTWDYWINRRIDFAQLAAERDWPLAEIQTLETYRDSDLAFAYPTLTEVRTVAEGLFEEVRCETHSYPLGDNCPTLCFRKADTN
jgi:SAM-dependent methyltransferase